MSKAPTFFQLGHYMVKEIANPKNECGKEWQGILESGCWICNGGPHYHYSSGSCDTEPCTKHGGPR